MSSLDGCGAPPREIPQVVQGGMYGFGAPSGRKVGRKRLVCMVQLVPLGLGLLSVPSLCGSFDLVFLNKRRFMLQPGAEVGVVGEEKHYR